MNVPARSRVLIPLCVAVAYVVAAKLGLAFAFETKQVTALWPPTGIALTALLIWGYRAWPGIWIGAFVSNAVIAEPVWTAAAIATGNTLAPVFGCFLLRRSGFNNSLDRVRDVLLLAAFGCIVAMTVSATNGVTALALARIIPWSAFASVWWVWWTGDAMGALFVAPPLLTWIARTPKPDRREGHLLELALLGALVLIGTVSSFLTDLPLRLSVYPFVMWIALRFTQRETATAIAIVFGVGVWGTVHGFGPWTTGPIDTRLVQLDSWMSILAVTGLVLGAAMAERRAARNELSELLRGTRQSAERLQEAFLPEQLPAREGLRCDVLYTPAGSEALIGGDWYDAFDLPDGRIAFVVGDVSGHGLDAAVAAAQIRRSIFIAAFETDDPAEILRKAELTEPAERHVPATAIVAIMSRDLASISYASAGHPPPIAAASGAAPYFLDGGDLPLGLGMHAGRTTHTQRLEPGTTILFYTDGLTEFKRDVEAGERAVLQAAASLVENPNEEHPAAFVQRTVMGDERSADDIVILAVQTTSAHAQSSNASIVSMSTNAPSSVVSTAREVSRG